MKPHLILIHSFPTNSVLLHGLEEYLADFFTVHFLDLPGFHKSSPPLRGEITIKRFSNFLDAKIAELDLPEYVVGGVSFGYLIIEHAKLDKRCKAVLAMEPYVNVQCLNIPFWRQKKYVLLSLLLKIMRALNVDDIVWNSAWFNRYLQEQQGYPKDRVDTIIRHIDARTFFTLTRILLSYKNLPSFHDVPHFLIGNFSDQTINFDMVSQAFVRGVRELHIASEPIDHYPKELTKSYFKTRIPAEHVERMIRCFEA